MTRILRIIETSNPSYGGPIEGARRFADVWAHDGHQQDLLTLDAPGETFLTDYPGKIFAVGPRRGKSPLQRYRYSPRMIPWLRKHADDYDAVIVSGLWRYMARGAMKALVRGKVPYFVFTHGMLDPWFRKKAPLKHWGKQISWWFAEGRLLANAEAVLFTTEEELFLAEQAFWPYHAKGVAVGYGTSDVNGDVLNQVSAFRSLVPELGQRPYILFLSRIHPKKGCDLLVEAFSKIAKSFHELDLVIAGPDQVGLVSDLSARALDFGIRDRLHFPGMLKGNVKAGAFRAAEAFILPSHQENFGIVVAEALAYGTPVLISDKVNIWREVMSDGAGFVEPDTADGTLRLITRFIDLPAADRSEMGIRARKCFIKRFDVENAARELMVLIQSRLSYGSDETAHTLIG